MLTRTFASSSRPIVVASSARNAASSTAFADAIGAWRPEQRRSGLTTPLTMLLFGMINWMYTWLRTEGPLTRESMAPVVTALFFGGVPAVAAKTDAARERRPE